MENGKEINFLTIFSTEFLIIDRSTDLGLTQYDFPKNEILSPPQFVHTIVLSEHQK